ncbi:TlpA family protein disulfide reductase [Acidipila rosea]|uniref:Peroxiredoxin n=1 Tax=Acidipila rosea TaxID=768535 RepID=A0A4R1LDA4_9BACT|nr:TlpA disulfide reductase family protein [Acidipila rosea]TCK75687.1 peroxiredoxin [Acidipila rosea]
MRLSLHVALVGLLAIGITSGCNDRGDHPSQIGKPAPGFAITNGAKTLRLHDYRGKVVVLNFWASWCPPCLEEFPSLTALQREMPQIAVLAVSFDTDAEAYRQYLVDNHIDLTVAIDQSQRSNLAYGTTRPPETYIIDRHGVIRRKFIGPQDWTSPEIVGYLKGL